MSSATLGLGTDEPPEDGWGGERVPPHDLLSEQSTLGGMMLGTGDIVDDVTESVKATDFYIPKHVPIFQAITALHAKGDPHDVIAVQNHLQAAGLLSRSGGAEYLHTLTGIVPTYANAGYYASLVAEKAVFRRLVIAGTRIVNMGYASEGQTSELIESARAEVDDVASGRKHTLRAIGENLRELAAELEKQPTFQETPWDSVNQQIGGFGPGELWVFGARPGDGKSIALFQVAMKGAKTGVVAYVSLEMKFIELQKRMVSQYGEIHMTAMRQHALTDQDIHRFKDAMQMTEKAPVYIDDVGSGEAYTVADVRAHARAVQRRGGTVSPLSMIVVDYIQLLSGKGENRTQEIASVSRGLKMLAGEFNVPVVVAAQLNRGERGARGASPAPKLMALRESGSLEQDADGVILMHRDGKRPRAIDLIVAKARSGAAGKSLEMQWQPHYARIQDPDWRFKLWGNEAEGDLA